MQLPVNNKAIYHTWLLIVLWVCQFLAEIVVIIYGGVSTALYASILSSVNQLNTLANGIRNCGNNRTFSLLCNGIMSNLNGGNDISSNIQSWLGTFLAASIISLVIGLIFFITHIIQVVFFAKRRLTPKGNFAFDCTRFVVWTVVWVVNIAAVAIAMGAVSSLLLVFTSIVWFVYLLSLIYASILFHRMRKGAYDTVPPGQPKAGSGLAQAEAGYKQELTYTQRR